MFVLVSLKIDVDATATLSQMESQIEEAGRAAMKETLKQAIRGAQEQRKRCPQFGSEQSRSLGTKRRVLLTRFGRVEVALKRLRCSACGQLFRPAEPMFSRGERPQCHARLARTGRTGRQFVAG